MPVEAYHRPTSLDDALDLAAEHESALEVISGGTLTMPAVNEGHAFPSHVLDLRELGLDYVNTNDGAVTLGATATLTQVIEEADVSVLETAAQHTGSWAVRNLATVGGNLFAPPPLGDFAVALLALDADVQIEGPTGERTIPLVDFYADSNALAADELVTEIQLPAVEGETAYTKYTRKQEPAPPIVTVVAHVERADDGTVDAARLALNGAGPHPMRMTDAEDALAGSSLDDETIEAAADAAADAADPPEDAVASTWYRRKMVREYVSRTLSEIATAEDTQ